MAPERKHDACLKPREYRDQKGECIILNDATLSSTVSVRAMPVTPCRTDMVRSYGTKMATRLDQTMAGSATSSWQRSRTSIQPRLRCCVPCGASAEKSIRPAAPGSGEAWRETETQVERLEQVFEMLNKPAGGKACKAIEKRWQSLPSHRKVQRWRCSRCPLISAVRAVENYEISCYEKLKTWAEELGMEDAVKLLDETLQEEKKTGAILWKIAEEEVNKRAA